MTKQQALIKSLGPKKPESALAKQVGSLMKKPLKIKYTEQPNSIDGGRYSPGAIVTYSAFNTGKVLVRSLIPFEGELYLHVTYGGDYKSKIDYYIKLPKAGYRIWKNCDHWFGPQVNETESDYKVRMTELRNEIQSKLLR